MPSKKDSFDGVLLSRRNNTATTMSSSRRRTLDGIAQKMVTMESVDVMRSDDDGIIETIAHALKRQQEQPKQQNSSSQQQVIAKKLFLMHGITANGAAMLKEALPCATSLQVLKLLHNEHRESLPVLLEGVANPNSTIVDLVLHDCPMIHNDNDIQQNQHHASHNLCNVIQRSKSLKRLSLANIPSFGDDGAAILASGIKSLQQQQQQLKQLKLIRCGIGCRGAVALAEAIEANTSLEILNLEDNPIEDAGAVAFSNALRLNQTLQTLNIGRNCEIGTSGITALSEMLLCNQTLQELNLKGNPGITLVLNGKKALLGALQKNVTITSLGFCTVRPHARKRHVDTGSVVILPGMPNISEQIGRQLQMNNIRSLFNANFLWHKNKSNHGKSNCVLTDKLLPYVLAKVSSKPSILVLFLQDYQNFLIPYL